MGFFCILLVSQGFKNNTTKSNSTISLLPDRIQSFIILGLVHVSKIFKNDYIYAAFCDPGTLVEATHQPCDVTMQESPDNVPLNLGFGMPDISLIWKRKTLTLTVQSRCCLFGSRMHNRRFCILLMVTKASAHLRPQYIFLQSSHGLTKTSPPYDLTHDHLTDSSWWGK